MKKTFNMDAIEFVNNYPKYLEEIEGVIKPDLIPIIEELKNTDPHDLVGPDVWFVSETQARGYVFNLFLRKCKNG